MAFTLAQLTALESAIASGNLEVRYDGKLVKYQTTGEMIRARDLMTAALIKAGLLSASPDTNRGPSSLAVFGRD